MCLSVYVSGYIFTSFSTAVFYPARQPCVLFICVMRDLVSVEFDFVSVEFDVVSVFILFSR